MGIVRGLRVYDRAGALRQAEQWALYNFMAVDGLGHVLVKIGISSLVFERVTTLRTACPYEMNLTRYDLVGTRSVAARIERAMHVALASKHTSGEWFRFKLKDADDKRLLDTVQYQTFLDVVRRPPSWRKITRSQLAEWSRAIDEKVG